MKNERLALGLDISTQGISAVILDVDRRTKVYEHKLDYCQDPRLYKFGIRKEDYILPPENEGEASQPPELFFASLDAIFEDLKKAISLKNIFVINCAGQQHSHVYLNRQAHSLFSRLLIKDSASSDLVPLLKDSLAFHRAPIWMTSDTADEASQIRDFIGGKEQAIELSGSNIPLRFTGAILRRTAHKYPEIYNRTDIIQLINSLIAAILTGNSRTPIDFSNACGMSLMDYRKKCWSDILIKAVSKGLPGGEKAFRKKLPSLVPPDCILGTIAVYFVRKYGVSSSCKILAGSGDNPQSKVLVAGDLLSLGTSIVNMVSTDGKTLDMHGFANAMYDGVGRPFIFGCRTNGVIVWDKLRAIYKLGKNEYAAAEKALKQEPIGRSLVFWQPRNESFPPSGIINLIRIGNEKPHLGTDYAGLIETTLASVYFHSKGFMRKTAEPLYVTGGAKNSREIIRRVAAIWNRRVVPIDEGGAALGAAVAGATGFLKAEGSSINAAQYIAGSALLKRERPFQPVPDDVMAFHRDGGFLDRFAKEEASLLAHS